MAININPIDIKGINQVGNSYQRKSAVPLDYYSIFTSFSDAQIYARTNPVAYVGQIITVIDKETKVVTNYTIVDTNGTLDPIGKMNTIGTWQEF
jgi:hypothetical protein